MSQKKLKIVFIVLDYITAVLAWLAFFAYRKEFIERVPFEVSTRLFLGLAIVPVLWIGIYYFVGTYTNLRRMYQMRILSLSMVAFAIGTLGIFFFLLLDDEILAQSDYYRLIIALFLIHSILTFIPRFFITRHIVRQIANRKTGFNTLLIGSSQKAVDICKEIKELPKGIGTLFVGFIKLQDTSSLLEAEMPYLGMLEDMENVLEKYQIEEVIIALDSSEQEQLKSIISRLQGRDVLIKITANMFDVLSGSVKMTNIFGALLVDVKDDLMPHWQFVIKRLMDVFASFIAILILSPVYLILMILVKRSSPGPIFFKQERIGKNNVPFDIIKFRTMVVNAEKNGPQLSSTNDNRITKIGRFMRKVRLDETPQFWNVIKGDMSLVGPRPERQFYIDQIAEREPHFRQLTKVKPGITSWGQVKYGYAENVDQMLQRMKYDLLYLKNMSIALDLKILLYTVIIVFKGSGK